ncbi:hypothetical protein ADK67_14460 [Saccharothrix sp. NRRL B-16348]|nr:hypothetical protein ADK67_14460 [Saccharothrix sp. NRRL B-16348]
MIRLAGDARRLRVEVEDGSPVLPRARLSATVGGWGIQFGQKLKTGWGENPEPGSKFVWCEMAAATTP